MSKFTIVVARKTTVIHYSDEIEVEVDTRAQAESMALDDAAFKPLKWRWRSSVPETYIQEIEEETVRCGICGEEHETIWCDLRLQPGTPLNSTKAVKA